MSDKNIKWIKRALTQYMNMLNSLSNEDEYYIDSNEFTNAVSELASELGVSWDDLIDY